MASLEFNESILQSISRKEQVSLKRAAVVSVMVHHQGTEFLLCTLIHGQMYQQILDVHFDENENITFFLEGEGTVHLTGFITDDDNMQELEIENEAPKLHQLLTRMTNEEQVTQQTEEDDKQSEKLSSLKAASSKKKRKQSGELHTPQKKRSGGDMFDSSKKSAKRLKKDLEDNFEDSDDEGEESSLPTSSEGEMDNIADDSVVGKRLDFSSSFDANDTTGSYKPSSKGDTSASLTPGASKSPLTSTGEKKKKKLKKRQMQTGESGEPTGLAASISKTNIAKKDAGSKKTNKNLEEKRTSINGIEDKQKSSVKMSKKEKRKEKNRLKKEQIQANKLSAHEESKKTDQNVVVLPGGLTIKDIKKGNGPLAKAGKYIYVYYTGQLAQSNKEFDSCTKGKPFRFRLGSGEVIRGWDMGIAGMQVGGKRTIKVPSKLGYGSTAQGPIPPNSVLLFDVELKAVS